MINDEKARRSTIVRYAMSSAMGEVSDSLCLVLFLMQEAKNSQSFWKPYIDILPTQDELGHIPLFYTPQQASLLRGTELWILRRKLKNMIKSVHKFLTEHSQSYTFTLQELHWAWAIVSSRSFGYYEKKNGIDGNLKNNKKSVSLIPLGDMFSHSASPTTTWIYSPALKGMLFPTVARQHSNLDRGEITVCYKKAKPRSDFINNYGFYQVEQTPTIDLLGLLQTRNNLLAKLDIHRTYRRPRPADKKLITYHNDNPGTTASYDTAMVLALSTLRASVSSSRAEHKETTITSVQHPTSKAHERLTLLLLRCIIEIHQAFYATSLQEDQQTLGQTSSDRLALMLNYMISEKKIIEYFLQFTAFGLEWLQLENKALQALAASGDESIFPFQRYISHVLIPLNNA